MERRLADLVTAQYDVFVNPNPRSRESVPYGVDTQSGSLDILRMRLTVPLSRVGVDQPGLPCRLIPVFAIAGERLAQHPQQAAGIDARLLRKPVQSLAAQVGEILDAIDAVVGGI